MTADEIHLALLQPFPPDMIGWKPQAKSKDGQSAMAAAYIDARCVMDRLDSVIGTANWSDSYEVTANGVVCKLTLNIAGTYVTKSDVGGFSDQPDESDQLKAAFSDSLKRAAVKFGIGRFLYDLPHQWCKFDGRRFTETPRLPPDYMAPSWETVAKAMLAYANGDEAERKRVWDKAVQMNFTAVQLKMLSDLRKGA